MFEKTDLLRVVRTPEGEFLIDKTGKASGRGAYICKNPACHKAAEKKRLFNKAYKADVGAELYGLLAKECESHVGGDKNE